MCHGREETWWNCSFSGEFTCIDLWKKKTAVCPYVHVCQDTQCVWCHRCVNSKQQYGCNDAHCAMQVEQCLSKSQDNFIGSNVTENKKINLSLNYYPSIQTCSSNNHYKLSVIYRQSTEANNQTFIFRGNSQRKQCFRSTRLMLMPFLASKMANSPKGEEAGVIKSGEFERGSFMKAMAWIQRI